MAKIKKGDKCWVMIPRFARALMPPQKGRIVALTDNLVCQVGVQFDKEGIGFHNCGGRVESKNCLWVRAKNLMNKKQVDAYEEELEATKTNLANRAKDVEEIKVDI